MAGLVLVAGVLGALGLSEALRARTQLVAARAALQNAIDNPAGLGTPEGRAAALAQVDGAVALIAGARSQVASSAVLTLAGAVPGLSHQRAGFIELIDDSTISARAGRELLAAIDALAVRTQFRDGAVPLDGLAELQQAVRMAGEVIGDRAKDGRDGLWGALGDAREDFDDIAGSSSRRLTETAEAIGAIRTFLGGDGRRRYLVAAQNNAEMRDQGAVLSYVVVGFENGRMIRERQGSVADLTLQAPAVTPIPPGTREVFGSIKPTQIWQSVNATADFAFSGRAMVDMYRQAAGQSLDGVIALDVPALAGLLRTVGSVSIDGVAEPISSSNVARMLLNDFYSGLGPTSDQTLRRERQGDVVRAVMDRLTSGTYDAVAVGRALGDAASGGHLRLWSADPAEEEIFERTGLGGGPGGKEADRTFHVAVQNRTASKLDYFIKPSVHQHVRLTKQGTAVVRTTVVIDNLAPPGAIPSYQFGPSGITENPGDYLAWVLLWGPEGSRQLQNSVAESGLQLSQFVLIVPTGESREVTFETVIANAVRGDELRLRLVPQPRLEPMTLSVMLLAEGRSVSGAPTETQGIWDRAKSLTWAVRG